MATYKVWLTVKDRYGNVKEVEGRDLVIDIGPDTFSNEDLEAFEDVLPFKEYIKKSESEYLATDEEVANTVRYGEFKFKDSSAEEAGN